MKSSVKPLQNILVIRRDNIGDLICTLPLIRNLRQQYPRARIDLLVNSYNQQTIEQHTAIDKVYAYTKAKHRSQGQSVLQIYWQRLIMLLALRRNHYDVVILAGSRFSTHALKLARSIKAQHIMGVVPENRVINAIDYALAESSDPHLHEVEHSLRLLSLLNIQADPTLSAQLQANLHRVQQLQQDLQQHEHYQTSRFTIGIHISARKASQRWSETAFITLIQILLQQHDCQILLFWAPGDENNSQHPGDNQKAQRIITALAKQAVFPIATQQLRELIAGVELCDQFICSDGGAMHIAAGLGKPLVCFFGESNAQQWHPWAVPHQLIQSPSQQVSDILPKQVIQEFALLQQKLTT